MTPFSTIARYLKELDILLVSGDMDYLEWSEGYDRLSQMGWSETSMNVVVDSLWDLIATKERLK